LSSESGSIWWYFYMCLITYGILLLSFVW
jgi:hypothetical protein